MAGSRKDRDKAQAADAAAAGAAGMEEGGMATVDAAAAAGTTQGAAGALAAGTSSHAGAWPSGATFEAKPESVEQGSPMARMAAACAVAALLFLGVTAMLSGACCLDASAANLVPSCIAAAVVVLLFVRADGTASEGKLTIGLAVALVAVTVLGWQAVSGGGTQVLNGFLYTLGTMTSEYALPYESGSALELAVFCTLASAAIAYLCAQLAMHGNIPVVLVIALAACVLVMLGIVPANGWTVVFAAGLAGALCLGGISRSDFRSARAMCTGLVTVAAIVAAAVLVSFAVVGSGAVDTSEARSALHDLVYFVRYGGASWAMPMGELDDLGALEASDRPALEVEVEGDTVEYLRGFVGEEYDGSSWTSLDGETVTDSQGLFYWLSQDGFETVSQIADAAADAGYEDAGEMAMTVTYVGARGGYAYLPYAYVSGGELSTSTDLAETTTDGESLQVTVSGTLLSESYLVQEQLESVQEQLGESSSTYLDDEGAYREFVYENYLDIPDEVLETFEELFGEAEELDTEEAKALVQAELESLVSYDDTVETDCGDEDFVTYFLTQSRTGYSVHYATAATLMLRYYGVPARYVEGYVLDTSDYEADDGSSTVTCDLTEADAHAWVEYYLDGVGWIPFDVTPGFGDAAFYEPTDDNIVRDDSLQWSVGDSDSDSPVREETEEEQEEVNGTVAVTRFEEFRPMILWSLLGLAIVLLAALVVRTVLLRRELSAFLAALRDGDLRDAVEDGFSYGVYLGEKCLGIAFGNSPYRSQGAAAEAGGLCSAATFEAAADANSRAMFSEGSDALCEDDRDAVLAFVDEARAGVRGNIGVFKRFWQRWALCIW